MMSGAPGWRWHIRPNPVLFLQRLESGGSHPAELRNIYNSPACSIWTLNNLNVFPITQILWNKEVFCLPFYKSKPKERCWKSWSYENSCNFSFCSNSQCIIRRDKMQSNLIYSFVVFLKCRFLFFVCFVVNILVGIKLQISIRVSQRMTHPSLLPLLAQQLFALPAALHH